MRYCVTRTGRAGIIKAFCHVGNCKKYLAGILREYEGIPLTEEISRMGRRGDVQRMVRINTPAAEMCRFLSVDYPELVGVPQALDLCAFLKEIVADFLRQPDQQAQPADDQTDLIPSADLCRVSDLCDAYMQHAEDHYVASRGELKKCRIVMGALRTRYGSRLAGSFSPMNLQDLRNQWVAAGLCRKTINEYAALVCRAFGWGVSMCFVKPETWGSLSAVKQLTPGRTVAVDNEPVKPVAWSLVNDTLPFIRQPAVRDLVLCQWFAGCRPGEACIMHRGDLDTTLDVWEYRPLKHKGQWRGHDRVIYLGPKSQAIVQQNLREMYRGVQGNPLEPVFKNRNLVAYTSATYAATISRATLRGSLPHWHPHQIRHSRATEVDRLLGRQAAAACIGDTIDAALVYTENNVTLARRVASELG